MNKNAEYVILKNGVTQDEYISLLALVFDDEVELDVLIHAGESDVEKATRMKAMGERYKNHPSEQKYLGIVNLHRRGQARPQLENCVSSEYRPRGQKLALKAAENIYDEVWPEVGERYRQYVRGMVKEIRSAERSIQRVRTVEATGRIAIDVESQSATFGDMLRKALYREEKELLANGRIKQKIGFLTKGSAPMIEVIAPHEHHRWARALAEIAQKVNATKIIHITHGVTLDPQTGEDNGSEVLLGFVIKPDGTSEAAAFGLYEKLDGCLRIKKQIKILDNSSEEHEAFQPIIPAWAADKS